MLSIHGALLQQLFFSQRYPRRYHMPLRDRTNQQEAAPAAADEGCFTAVPVYIAPTSAADAFAAPHARPVFGRAVREVWDVQTSHGPPGAAATTITSKVRELATAQLDRVEELVAPPRSCCQDNDCSALEELLAVPELRELLLSWLPMCDLARSRRLSRRFKGWGEAALEGHGSVAVVCNAMRDYESLDFAQRLDPRTLRWSLLGELPKSSDVSAARRHQLADDCAQVGDQLYALRGSTLDVTTMPELDSHAEEKKESGGSPPASPVVEPPPSPERVDSDEASQIVEVLAATPQNTPASLAFGTPEAGERALNELTWHERSQLPAPPLDQPFSNAISTLKHVRCGGRLCAIDGDRLLLIGGGVDRIAPLLPPPQLEDLDEDLLDMGRVERPRAPRRAHAAAEATAAQRPAVTLGATAQVVTFSTATGLWERFPSMLEARRDCAVALLPDGWVMAAGGSSGSGALSSAEIYSPVTQVWTPLPPMQVPSCHCSVFFGSPSAHVCQVHSLFQSLIFGPICSTRAPLRPRSCSAAAASPSSAATSKAASRTASASTPLSRSTTTTLRRGNSQEV